MDNKKNMTDNDCPIYRPFQNNDRITIKKDHYSTSLDPRGYIPGNLSFDFSDFRLNLIDPIKSMNILSIIHQSCGIEKQVMFTSQAFGRPWAIQNRILSKW
jgi:hypothetical protein